MIILLSAMSFMTVHASQIDIRLQTEAIEGNDMYVNVQIKNSEASQMVLAGQNYRIYYNADALTIDKKGSKSLLSTKQYSNLDFSQVLEHIDATGAGQLDFEENMGYANFSIDLKDVKNGGQSLNNKGDWMTVARIKFEIAASADVYEVVWGREGKSEAYATAFVHIAEWKGSFHTETVAVNFYGDLYERREAAELSNEVEVKVGPNPSADFIQVAINGTHDATAQAVMYDLNGKEVKRARIGIGENQVKIDVTDLVGASYLIELTSSQAQSIHRQLIVVAH